VPCSPIEVPRTVLPLLWMSFTDFVINAIVFLE
jgi:hypothetical protein